MNDNKTSCSSDAIPDLTGHCLIIIFFVLLSEVVSAEPFHKPIPKPRSKALDKALLLDETHRDRDLEIPQTVERHRAPSDDSSSDSASSPTRGNLQCVSGEGSHDETHSNDSPPASAGSHSQGDGDDGNFSSNPQTLC